MWTTRFLQMKISYIKYLKSRLTLLNPKKENLLKNLLKILLLLRIDIGKVFQIRVKNLQELRKICVVRHDPSIRLLKLSELKQLKSIVRIGGNFKAKMA